ncbi:MAG: hypothetical protein AB7S78_07870 [Candidatus Omnitrophota bacterium]
MHFLKIYHVFLLSSLILVSPSIAEQPGLDPATIEICNNVVKSIYNEIEKLKPRYHDLELFNIIALKKNQWGFDFIKYRYLDVVGSKQVDKLEFGVEFVPIDADQEYSFEGAHFEYAFPLLKVKLIAYQNNSNKHRQIEILPFVKEFARPLLDYQSKQLPIKLSLYADKSVFKVDEPVTFIAEFENLTGNNIKIKDLSSDSIAFAYDKVTWGSDLNLAHPTQGNEVLRPNRALKRKFKLNGFTEPQDLTIHATYLMNFKGVEPTATLNLKIVK